MGTIFSRVKLSGKHVAALLALMLLSAVTAMLLPTALASMIDIGVAGENRNTILIIAVVMATLAILGCLFNMAATVLSAKVSTKFAADLRREIFHQVQDFSAAEMERFGTASLVTPCRLKARITRTPSSVSRKILFSRSIRCRRVTE